MPPIDDQTVDRPLPPADPDSTVHPPAGLTPSVILGASAPPETTPAIGAWAPPGYVVEKEIGRGGMGVVYLARQSGLNRLVALKLIKAGDADTVSVVRFLAEAEAVAAVRHPNVVQVYQYGEHQGRPFLAFEYCDGGSLHDRLASREPQRPKDVARLLAAIADGVQAAHAVGIVHRDLKPGNVLFDAAGGPRVTDFGLAKRPSGNDLTQTNAVMGTPAYMSPEQARGQGKFADPRSDVWAFGVMMYELLTGHRPYTGKTPLDVLQQMLDSTPAGVRTLAAGVPRDLELICNKCLRTEVAERYATAGELAADLRRLLAGKAISARPVSKARQAWKWAARNKLATVSLMTAGAALALGSTASLLFALRAKSEAIRSETQLDRAERLLYATQIREAERLGREGHRGAMYRELNSARLDFRGWEHDHLWSRLMQGVLPLAEGGSYTSVAISADGRRVVAGCRNGSTQVWDATSRRLMVELRGHREEVTAVAVSADGRRVATGSKDRTGRVWDTSDGRVVAELAGHADEVAAVSLSADGKCVATGSKDRTARVWDADSGQERFQTEDFDQVTAVVLSADGRVMVTNGGVTRSARVWDIGSRRLLRDLLHTTAYSLAISADGRRIMVSDATVISGPRPLVWDGQSGRVVGKLTSGYSVFRSVALSADGRRAVMFDRDGLTVWDVFSGQAITSFNYSGGFGSHVAVSADGRRFVCQTGKTVSLWDTEVGRAVHDLRHGADVTEVAISADGRRVVCASQSDATVWDSKTGRMLSKFEFWPMSLPNSFAVSGDGRRIFTCNRQGLTVREDNFTQSTAPLIGSDGSRCSVAASADGRRFVTGNRDAVRVWDATTGQVVSRLVGQWGNVPFVAMSGDGRKVLVMSRLERKGSASVWQADDGRLVAELAGDGAFSGQGAMSADGCRVVTAGGGSAHVWDAESGQLVAELKGHAGFVRAVAITADGSKVVTGSDDHTARLWDVVTGQSVIELRGHTAAVTGVSISADGRRIATGGNDQSARVWLAAAEQVVVELVGHRQEVTALAVSGSGDRIVSTSPDGVRTWDTATGRLLDTGPGSGERGPTDVTSRDGRVRAYSSGTSVFFGSVAKMEARRAFEDEQWRESWDRYVRTKPTFHLAEADACAKEDNPSAEAYHLRQLLKDHAFADVDLLKKLHRAEAKTIPREVLPPPR